MIDLHVSEKFRDIYPDAIMGILAVENVVNAVTSEALEAEKRLLEEDLRAAFPSREEIKADITLQAYAAYYKQFKKNYHVFFQVESVAVKSKPIPGVNALVEAMFMGELAHMLLTAGHDLDKVQGEVRLDSASGEERYTKINGEEQQLKANDMFVADEEGVLSSVIYGPDRRTSMTDRTERALFTIYAPAGITRELVMSQMNTIEGYIRVFSPNAITDTKQVFPA